MVPPRPAPPAASPSPPRAHRRRPLGRGHRGRAPGGGAEQGGRAGARPAPPAPEFWHPDLDALKELEALVSGRGALRHLRQRRVHRGVGLRASTPALVRKLRRGDFSVQAHLDLHGKSRAEAKGEVDAFLRRSREQGKRCVLLVHGRGLHSRDQVPVLKEALRSWLATARFGRHVLAFATARPRTGARGRSTSCSGASGADARIAFVPAGRLPPGAGTPLSAALVLAARVLGFVAPGHAGPEHRPFPRPLRRRRSEWAPAPAGDGPGRRRRDQRRFVGGSGREAAARCPCPRPVAALGIGGGESPHWRILMRSIAFRGVRLVSRSRLRRAVGDRHASRRAGEGGRNGDHSPRVTAG